MPRPEATGRRRRYGRHVPESELRALLTRRLDRRQLIALDAAFAVAYTLILLGTASAGAPGEAVPPGPAECLVIAGTGLPLAVRRLWPVAVFALVLALSVAALPAGLPTLSFAAAAYALYAVALVQPRRRWIPTAAIGAFSGLTLLAGALVGPRDWHAERFRDVLLALAVLGGAWTLGRAVRERRAQAEQSAARLADQAVAEERLRIARELHDVVAHSMSLIAVKAGVANHVAAERPEEARDALRVIESASRGALAEMRQLLGVLRTGGPADTELAPAPGLAGLAGLVERAALAGVRVDLELKVGELPEGVALSAHRIVQEALTNVVKHAAPAHCRVLVEADGHQVHIEVTDDGPGTRTLPHDPAPGAGHGLIGMRERAMMYGGDFTAGPRPEGGFAVRARLPYDDVGSR
ncbi:two-component sensor histidine kinase [Actinomadura sp. NBRC 104425]|nr:two-component sensor histidine kinase [Actinomadura sp. NBRC 104425]